MKKKDFLFIFFVIITVIISFFVKFKTTQKGDTVLIYSNNELYKKIPLNENLKINIDDKNIVVVENGSCYMKWADCPDKICVKTGKISDNSKSIVCIPNKVMVKVLKKSDIDAISN